MPLLLFAGAANRVPMVGIGILQYVAPILQLACGVLIYHEPMPAARLAGIRAGLDRADHLHRGRRAGLAGQPPQRPGRRPIPTAATVEPAAAIPSPLTGIRGQGTS